MDNYLFSVFPNENFIDLALYQYAGSSVLPPIHLVRLPKIIISFTMSFPAPECCPLRIKRGNLMNTISKAGKVHAVSTAGLLLLG